MFRNYSLKGDSVLTSNTPVQITTNSPMTSNTPVHKTNDSITQTSTKRRGRGLSINTILQRNKENNSTGILI